jgi:hypothetical protein
MNLRANSSAKFGDFAKITERLVPRLLAGAQTAADAVLAESQTLVPVGATSDLKSSGRTDVEWSGTKVMAYVSYLAHHAAFVEFGTGLAGRGTYPFDLPVSGTPITGAWVYDYKQQNWPGMVSRPYLRPALDNCRQAIQDAFTSAIASM